MTTADFLLPAPCAPQCRAHASIFFAASSYTSPKFRDGVGLARRRGPEPKYALLRAARSFRADVGRPTLDAPQPILFGLFVVVVVWVDGAYSSRLFNQCF